RLRRQRRDQVMTAGDAADRLSDEDLLVGGAQRRCGAGRNLVLAVAELRVVLLEDDLLCRKRAREVVEVVLRRRRADRREAEAGIDGHELTVDERREGELVLEPSVEPGI